MPGPSSMEVMDTLPASSMRASGGLQGRASRARRGPAQDAAADRDDAAVQRGPVHGLGLGHGAMAGGMPEMQ